MRLWRLGGSGRLEDIFVLRMFTPWTFSTPTEFTSVVEAVYTHLELPGQSNSESLLIGISRPMHSETCLRINTGSICQQIIQQYVRSPTTVSTYSPGWGKNYGSPYYMIAYTLRADEYPPSAGR